MDETTHGNPIVRTSLSLPDSLDPMSQRQTRRIAYSLSHMLKPGIPLTDEEQALFERITFDQGWLSYETVQANAALVEKLFDLLAARGEIPEQRRRWLTEAEFNLGGRGKSRVDQWVSNGTAGREILRHPSFLQDLRYFLCGASLSSKAKADFRRAVEDCGMVTSGDVSPLSKLARDLARQFRLEPLHASGEFYKLALDCGITSYASFVRAGVQSYRPRR